MSLTSQDLDLVLFSLNETFNACVAKLEKTNLGDIERQMVLKTKQDSYDLMMKIKECWAPLLKYQSND